MYCTECGAQLPDGAKFCPQCGTKTISVDSPNTTSSTIPPAKRIVSQKAQWEELPIAESSAREDRFREVLVDKANWEGEVIELERQENRERLEAAVNMIVDSVKSKPQPAPKPLKPKTTREETFYPELMIVKKRIGENTDCHFERNGKCISEIYNWCGGGSKDNLINHIFLCENKNGKYEYLFYNQTSGKLLKIDKSFDETDLFEIMSYGTCIYQKVNGENAILNIVEEVEYAFDNHTNMIECCYYALTNDSILIYDPNIEMIDEYKLEYHSEGMRARNDSFGLAIFIFIGACGFIWGGLLVLVERLGGYIETLSIPMLCVSIVITLIFAYRTYHEKAHFEILKDTKTTLKFKEVIVNKNL